MASTSTSAPTPRKQNTGAKPAPTPRSIQFSSAVQLAIQRAAHKWTYEDFQECFPLFCEEQAEGSRGVFHTIAAHHESTVSGNCEQLFKEYEVDERLDRLHLLVKDARERRARGERGPDVWSEDLEPRAVVRGRTVPLLESVRDRLQTQLEELRRENARLQGEIQANVDAKEKADNECHQRLNAVDKALEKWDGVEMEKMEMWAVEAAERR